MSKNGDQYGIRSSNGFRIISIRDWVSRPEEDSWIFLSLREEQKTTIEPLITLWFSIFIKAV
ncbi:type IV secretion system DNA-binding domain-containing protein, partial [Acinetobacter baumannii]|uniref:type IV secretion system DNA-binding domain-containing protein n=1 Tax=Acinetobacter baumannii TaxID=470 RepID=UPI0038CDC0F0